MSKNFLNPKEINYNSAMLFSNPGALLTVEDKEKTNTMTIGWGEIGFAWGKNIITVMVRPERFTYPLLENAETFSVSFFDDGFKDKIIFCGRNSGKDVDKFTKCNFSVDYHENTPYIKEGKLTAICKKLYTQEMSLEGFEEGYKDLGEKFYGKDGKANGGLHKFYVAEILSLFEE